MIRYPYILFVFMYLLITHKTWGQSDDSFRISGYLKNMQTVLLPGDDFILMENLIHNRINFRWNIENNLHIAVEMRNRVFAGNITALTPGFGQMIQEFSDDWLTLSVLWLEKPQYAVQSTFDRFYIDLNQGKWNIRAGRQRINWGINLAFNPNDLFNAYNFLDFDYEERPGADAIRIQYYYSFASGFDIAVKGASNMEDFVGAIRWFTNYKEFDFQWISGLSRGDLALGGGWAGHIGNAGWKGELTLFHPVLGQNRNTAFSATTGIDYTFGKGWLVYFSYLYNSDAGESLQDILLQTEPLTARSLYPFRHNVLMQVSYPFSPLISVSSAFIYSLAGDHPLVWNPGLRMSLAENWDLDLICQSFSTLKGNPDRFSNQLFFLRFRWSY